jgi:DNA-binding NarL/FixJ family response regulator
MKQSTRIFFVEDDPILAKVLAWRLEKLGYSVCGSSNDGVEAVDRILEEKPDLVLLDIELGGRYDGIHVGSILKSKSRIPFIYLTSHSEERYLTRAKMTGPKGYVLKTFDAEQLRIAIELALHQ